jgi:DNA helicase TIP49 (TBP-interacting protein)
MKKTEELLSDIRKSIKKAVYKSIKEKHPLRQGFDPIDDLLDPDDIAEVDPKKIPPRKQAVMMKTKNKKKSYTKEEIAKKISERLKKTYIKKDTK